MKKGWESNKLGDVCEFQRGLTYAKSDEADVSDNVVLRATNIDLARNLLIFDELKYISDKVVVPESKKVKKGSLMICMASGSKSHLGKVAYIDEDYGYAFGGFMGMLTPRNGLWPKYLFHLMTSEDYKDFIGALSDGANINNLTFDKLKLFSVPVPPLPEQQRIVGVLDEAFDGLATAKANAEKNLQNARALFESHLQSVFTQRGKGWVDRQLASLCHEITVGHVGSMKTEYKESGIPFLRSQNIRPFEVSMENAMFIGEAFHRALKKSQLRPGDLAIVRTGYPGTAAVIPPELPDSNCSDLVIVRPSKEVNAHFLAAFFNSSFGKQLVLGKIVGAAQKHFNITAAKEVMLHVPPIAEQRTIVAMVDDLREETQRLTAIYEQKLAALEALKKSLLHQAFSGNL
jgi:type I restriction enzyme S subunit